MSMCPQPSRSEQYRRFSILSPSVDTSHVGEQASSCIVGDQLGAFTMSFQMPKIATTGVAAHDRNKELKRLAFQNIIEHLWAHEDDVYACRSFLDERRAQQSDAADANDQFKTFTTLGKFDEAWIVQQLLNRTSLTKAGLTRAKKYDEQTVHHIFAFILSASLSMKLPQDCRSKTVFDRMVDDRVEKVGRCKSVGDNMILASGQVDWLSKGCYKLVWSAEKTRCVEIVHQSSSATAAVPEHVMITPAYALTNNFSDMQAVVSLAPNNYILAQFFGAFVGPQAFGCWFGRSRLVHQAAHEARTCIENIRRQASAGQTAGDTRIFDDVKQERKQVAATKARKRMMEKQKEVNNKRKISLA